ncbi:DNA gyrase inhibitor YacG [Acetobacter sp.]|uniref:DNA gyrase inhibitor YacG n=1 Tax=Acetobacter sp. TaxID=440 RepID=UPI0039E7B486
MAETPACPICGKPAVAAFRPFCSRRCADIDLGRWFSGAYHVPDDTPAEDGNNSDEEGNSHA